MVGVGDLQLRVSGDHGCLHRHGIERVSEMAENVRIWADAAPLTPDDLAEMDRIRDLLGDRFCRGCDYCQPCSEEIAISTVLSIGSNMRRFPLSRVFGEPMAATTAVMTIEACWASVRSC